MSIDELQKKKFEQFHIKHNYFKFSACEFQRYNAQLKNFVK